MLKCENCGGKDFTITAKRNFVCDGCMQVFGKLRNDNSIIHCGKCGGSNIEIVSDDLTLLTMRCKSCDIRQDINIISATPETGDNL